MITKTAVTTIDSNAKILYVSKPFETYLSFILPNEIGQNLLEFNNHETKVILNDFLNLVFSSDSPIEEILEFDEFKVRLSGHCFDGEYAIIYWNDITELSLLNGKEKNAPLFSVENLNETTLKRLTNNLPLAVFELNLYRDGRFEFGFVNEEMKTFFPEFDREAVNANNSLLFSRVHHEDKEKLKVSIRDVFKNNIWDIEYRIINKGEIRWIKGYGRPEKDILSNENFITVCTYLEDITVSKTISDQLKLVNFSFRNAATTIQLINKDGSFYDFNEAAHNLLGYSREEYQKMSIPEFAVDYNKDYWPIHWNELKKVGTLTFESVLRKKDKSLIDVEIRANYINYGDLELNYAFVTDITEKKRIEEALKKSNERYEFATLATSDIIWETDLENNTLFLSNNFSLIFGHKVNGIQPLENNIWRQNVHPDDIIRIQQSEAEIIKNGQDRWQGEYRLKKSDGTYAQIFDRSFAIKNDEGKVVRLIGAMEDITLKRQEEEKLKLFETVILNTTEAIIIRETKKSNKSVLPIVYVNDAFTKMTGYHLHEIKGKSLNFLSGPLTQKDEQAKLKHAISKFQSGSMEVINYKKNGETFWASISTFPVANNKGEYTHWVSIQRDITVKKEAEKEREKLLGELLINNKELRQFSYITTHNLRAPLTNLVSICRLLNTETIQDSMTIKLIEAFKASTIHLNDTLNDLINILIIKENPNIFIEEQNLKIVFDTVINSIANIVNSTNASLDVDFSQAETVSFNNAYLESIFLNLLTNSFKYAHPDRSPHIKIQTTKSKEGAIKLIYSDNGIGMNMAHVKDRIFGLYQRFHSNTDSKGIGLYLIHSQITALGGTIEVTSEVNVGTTFIITFRIEK